MREIELTKGFKSVVDADDFERINQHSWSIIRPDGRLYAGTRIDGKYIYLHRFVLGKPPFNRAYADHINGNTLDNRKQNLRWATASQNNMNATKKNRNGSPSSKFKGVQFDRRGMWRADIHKNKKRIFLGYFKSEIDAAYKYNEYAQRFHGEFAKLNEI